VLAAEGGGGLDSSAPRRPTALAGVKLGMPVATQGKYPNETLRTCTLDTKVHEQYGFKGFPNMPRRLFMSMKDISAALRNR
jgi:hypothetical protein